MPVLRGLLQAAGALVDVEIGWSAIQVRRLRLAQQAVPPTIAASALLDTGAEITCFDTNLVQYLNLPLAQVTLANVPALGGLQAGAHYHASLTIVHPSGVLQQPLVVANLLVLEASLANLGYEALIGRDILDRCDFLYRGRRGTFSLVY